MFGPNNPHRLLPPHQARPSPQGRILIPTTTEGGMARTANVRGIEIGIESATEPIEKETENAIKEILKG